MRKIILLGAILLCTLFSYAQDGVRIYANSSKDQAYQGVYLRKADVPDMFPKSYMVWLSEKPNGVESGYYGVQTGNGFLYNGSKDKIKLGKMKDAGNGWYYFDFGKDLYIRRIESLSHLENIRLVPSGTKKPSSSKTSAVTTASTAAVKEESAQKQNYITPLDISKLKKPAFAENGWSLAETTKEKDGATCERYVKEIDDEDFSIRFFKYPNGDFFTDSVNNYMGDFMITQKNGVKSVRISGLTYWLYPNGNYLYREKNNESSIFYVYPYSNNGKKTLDDKKCYILKKEKAYEADYRDLLLVINNPIDVDKTSNKVRAYTLEKNWSPLDNNRHGYDDGMTGFVIGDRLCVLDSLGNPIPRMQKIKSYWMFANRNDTIINVKDSINIEGKYKAYEFFYKNGDRIKYVHKGEFINYIPEESYIVGTIHRNGGILKLKKSEDPVLTKPDGTTITYNYFGKGLVEDKDYLGGKKMDGFSIRDDRFLSLDSILICDATVTYPNGRTEEYTDGFPESYWSRLRAQRDAAKKAANKEALAKKRNPFIQKWGFYPGDYDTNSKWKQCIIPGRPFGAIQEYFSTSLIQNNGSAKYYKVFTNYWHGTDENGKANNDSFYVYKDAYVWVRNGKITSVSWK